MTREVETNGAANQVIISRQLSEYIHEKYAGDQELIGMVEDLGEAARRLYAWLRFLQECKQQVKISYTEYVSVVYKEEK